MKVYERDIKGLSGNEPERLVDVRCRDDVEDTRLQSLIQGGADLFTVIYQQYLRISLVAVSLPSKPGLPGYRPA